MRCGSDDFDLTTILSVIVVGGAAICCAGPAIADPQHPVAQAPTAEQAASEAPDYNGEDFTRPETSISTRFRFRTSSGATSQTERGAESLQLNSKLDLARDWKLGTLFRIPFIEKTTTTFGDPVPDKSAGFGGLVFQPSLVNSIDQHWAYGFGARLVSPPLQDSLGAARWQIMPGVGVRYSFVEIGPDTYFVPVFRYAISFAGDPAARTIREPQIAPTLNIGLPDRWFVTFYPSNDIRINYGTPISGQTGRLFLPLDMAIGKEFTNNLVVSLEGSVPIVKEYPVYNFKTELRVNWVF